MNSFYDTLGSKSLDYENNDSLRIRSVVGGMLAGVAIAASAVSFGYVAKTTYDIQNLQVEVDLDQVVGGSAR
ncbi:hypothetical protein H6796_02345 [Candidatus Nomurabacteria bacterium]|nr:hypothetical protein [Candidatus Nomurabacteria bacterium]